MSNETPPFHPEMFRRTFDHAGVGLAHVALDGTLLRANRKLCDMLGYTHDELLSRTLEDLVDPEDADVGLSNERLLLAGHIDSYVVEKRYLRKAGALVWVRQTMSLMRDHDDKPAYLIAVVADISQCKHTEIELKDREASVRAILDQAPLGIAFFDSHLRYQRINAYSARVTGHTPEELLGRTLREVMVESFGAKAAEEIVSQFQHTLDTGEPLCIRSWSGHLQKQGDAPYFSDWEIRCVKHNHVPMGILLTFVDITPHEMSRRELAQSQARLRAILDTAADGIITIDQGGIIESVNAAADAIFGYAPGELVGQNVDVLMSQGETGWHVERIAQYLNRGTSKVIGAVNELMARRKDGRLFPIELAVSEVHLPERRIFTGVVHDITRRRQLEKQILHISESEQARIGQDLHDGICQELVAATMSLNLLASRLEERSIAESADVREIIAQIRSINTHTRDLAHGLHPVRLEHGGLSAALEDLAGRISRHTGVKCTCLSDESILISDTTVAVHLYRIAQEAINNAIRHGKAGTIELSLVRDGTGIRLAIRDSGIGISNGAPRGAGMGIRTMKYRANAIGGNLHIMPAPGQGTIVSCVLAPAHPEQQHEYQDKKETRSRRLREVSKKNPRRR